MSETATQRQDKTSEETLKRTEERIFLPQQRHQEQKDKMAGFVTLLQRSALCPSKPMLSVEHLF